MTATALLGPLEPERGPLYSLGLRPLELEAVRDAIELARIVSRERMASAAALAETNHTTPHFWPDVERFWSEKLCAAELAAEAIERAAPGVRL